jgi:hypothetical protein
MIQVDTVTLSFAWEENTAWVSTGVSVYCCAVDWRADLDPRQARHSAAAIPDALVAGLHVE